MFLHYLSYLHSSFYIFHYVYHYAITLSLTCASSSLITITQAGELCFLTAPDFENGDPGPFPVTFVATEDSKKSLTGELAVEVSVGYGKDTTSLAFVKTGAPKYHDR
mgnify:CR=1 FL=1